MLKPREHPRVLLCCSILFLFLKFWVSCRDARKLSVKLFSSYKKQIETCFSSSAYTHLYINDLYNLAKRFVNKLTKLRKIDFSMECVMDDFFRDFTECVKIWLFGSLKSFRNSWGNSYIHILLIKSISVSLAVKRNCAKLWQCLQMSCPRLFENFPFHLFPVENALKLQISSKTLPCLQLEHHLV